MRIKEGCVNSVTKGARREGCTQVAAARLVLELTAAVLVRLPLGTADEIESSSVCRAQRVPSFRRDGVTERLLPRV
jgi:hypothetical protein